MEGRCHVRETPLTHWHKEHGAKMTEFGGFLMPIAYQSGILKEHAAVRQSVGIFDVSHMGEFWVWGERAAEFLDVLVTNQPSQLAVGQALYSPMCDPDGGTLDDLLIYRVDGARFLLVVNAGNAETDWQWVSSHAREFGGVECADASNETGLVAVQGPNAQSVLEPWLNIDLAELPYYHFRPAVMADAPVLVSRTGYTGEDGFELYIPHQRTLALWERLVDQGAAPVGLGARDTLRLEARLPLYGHELTREITPLEAGLGMFIKWNKTTFIGRDALSRQKAEGLRRRSVGLRVDGGIARSGYPVAEEPDGPEVGVVTSGTQSPTLGYPIALALVDSALATAGTALYVRIRDRYIPCTVVKTPFYQRRR